MSDLISRDALLRYIDAEIDESREEREDAEGRGNECDVSYNSGEIAEARRIRKHVAKLPTTDAVPVVYARWINDHGTHCSSCGGCLPTVSYTQGTYYGPQDYVEEIDPTPYCPHCGAKMDLKEYLL